jgi:uncharacterized membrane protein YjdF
MTAFRVIGAAATAGFVVISFVGTSPGSTYRVSFVFLSFFVWLLYGVRRKLFLHPFHFALFASALLLHDCGAFGWYREKLFGLEFDFYVHYYFGLVASLFFYRAFRHHFPAFDRWTLWLFVVMFVLGFGALHELMEFSTNLLLGPEKGMLKPEIAGFFDTHEDLAHNFGGALTGLAFYALWEIFVRARPAAGSTP